MHACSSMRYNKFGVAISEACQMERAVLLSYPYGLMLYLLCVSLNTYSKIPWDPGGQEVQGPGHQERSGLIIERKQDTPRKML